MRHNSPASIIAASVILEVIAVVCVTLRIYTRYWKRLVSDWIILAAFVLATGLTVTELYGMQTSHVSLLRQ